VYNIFISHLHWDHIQGFPFFTPAYIPGNRVNIYGCHEELRKAFEVQQSPPCFPVPLAAMKAEIRFNVLEPGKACEVGGAKVRAVRQNHPGGSYGYRFEIGGKSMVYSTDAEHFKDALDDGYYFWEFASGADLLIYDAQYNFADAVSVKENWGHSSNVLGVEQAVKAGAKKLCLFHNEHTCGDAELEKFLQDTREYLSICAPKSTMEIFLAYDGLELQV
jgi:phosphoribosyl 1,2-cyclic phosphodiesterase